MHTYTYIHIRTHMHWTYGYMCMYDRFIQAHIYSYIHIHTIHTHTYTYALCKMHMLCILYVFPVSCLYLNRTLNLALNRALEQTVSVCICMYWYVSNAYHVCMYTFSWYVRIHTHILHCNVAVNLKVPVKVPVAWEWYIQYIYTIRTYTYIYIHMYTPFKQQVYFWLKRNICTYTAHTLHIHWHAHTSRNKHHDDTIRYMHILELEGRGEQSDSEFTRLQVSRQAAATWGPADAAARSTVTAAAAAAHTDSESDRNSRRLSQSGCQWQVTVTGIVTRTAGALPAHWPAALYTGSLAAVPG